MGIFSLHKNNNKINFANVIGSAMNDFSRSWGWWIFIFFSFIGAAREHAAADAICREIKKVCLVEGICFIFVVFDAKIVSEKKAFPFLLL